MEKMVILFLIGTVALIGCSMGKGKVEVAKGYISAKRVVSKRLVAQIDLSSWIQESFKVSSDNKRVAYVARVNNKWFVVVDGKEGEKHCVIVTIGGGRIIFSSPDSLNYFVVIGSCLYSVEEKIA